MAREPGRGPKRLEVAAGGADVSLVLAELLGQGEEGGSEAHDDVLALWMPQPRVQPDDGLVAVLKPIC